MKKLITAALLAAASCAASPIFYDLRIDYTELSSVTSGPYPDYYIVQVLPWLQEERLEGVILGWGWFPELNLPGPPSTGDREPHGHPSEAPEPATIAMALTGLLALVIGKARIANVAKDQG